MRWDKTNRRSCLPSWERMPRRNLLKDWGFSNSPAVEILRLLRAQAGLSQQELAAKLQIHPSRLVAILDNLEKRGFVERRANPDDRRLYSLHPTQAGGETLEKIGSVARKHQDDLLSNISWEERNTLATLLLKIADQQGLVRGVHPGYQRLGRPKRSEANEGPSDGQPAGD